MPSCGAGWKLCGLEPDILDVGVVSCEHWVGGSVREVYLAAAKDLGGIGRMQM